MRHSHPSFFRAITFIRVGALTSLLTLLFQPGESSAQGTETWALLNGSAAIPARYGPAAAYDAVGDRMIVFGGNESPHLNDTWAYHLDTDTWEELAPGGTLPPPRVYTPLVYDPPRNRMILFGGSPGSSSATNDLWELKLVPTPAWNQLSPTGTPPEPRSAHTLTYDPVGDRVLLIGGGVGSTLYNDVWELSLGSTPSWTRLSTVGTPPPPRGSHTAVYVPGQDRIIVFGGELSGNGYSNETWELNLNGTPTWLKLTPPTNPGGRGAHIAFYDPFGDRMLMFGGYTAPYQTQDSVWEFDLSGPPAWTELSPEGPLPDQRAHMAAVYDSRRFRIVLFGGWGGFGHALDDTWELGWLTSCQRTVVAWGRNDDGEIDVPEPNSNFTAIAAGENHSLGVRTDGSIVGWGSNFFGQIDVPVPNTGFVGVAAGSSHSLGLKSDGTVVAWGFNDWGQLDVPVPNSDFVRIATRNASCLGIKSDGSIVGWGYDVSGQLDVPAPNSDFVDVSVGGFIGMGLKADSSVVVWGNDTYGQLTVPPPNSGFVGIAAGIFHCLGVKADGTIVAWGNNGGGELDVPAPNADFIAVAAGAGLSVGLKANGTVAAWGTNPFGPVEPPPINNTWTAIAAGSYHALGVLLDAAPSSPEFCAVALDESNVVHISWSDVAAEDEYRIYRNGYLIAAVGADVTEYTESLVSGCTFSYGVSAAAGGCESMPCQTTISGLAPSGPTACSTEPSCNGSVTVSWEGQPWADGYRVYRDGVLIAATSAAETDFVDGSPDAGTIEYSVSAVQGACESLGRCSSTATVLKTTPLALPGQPKIALHAQPYSSAKACQKGAALTCPGAVVHAPVDTHLSVYLLVADVDAGRGIRGVQFGINYDALSYATYEGVWVPSFYLCADVAFTRPYPHPYPPPFGGRGGGHHYREQSTGPYGPEFPEPNTGGVFTWAGCRTSEPGGPGTGVVSVVGWLDVIAYGAGFSGRLWATRLPSASPEALVADCSVVAIPIPDGNLGWIGFGGEGGYNPCSPESLYSAPAGCWTSTDGCGVRFAWNDLPDETAYVVYRDGGHLTDLPADSTQVVDYPPPGVPHTYGVAALGPTGVSPQCLSNGPQWLAAPEPRTPGTLSLRAERNPFTPPVSLAFAIPGSRSASITIYSVSGKQVRQYEIPAGVSGRLDWDGRDDRGTLVGTGIYFARLASSGQAVIQRLVVVK